MEKKNSGLFIEYWISIVISRSSLACRHVETSAALADVALLMDSVLALMSQA